MFDSSCNPLGLNNRYKIYIIFSMYDWFPSVKGKRIHVPPYIFDLLDILVNAVDFSLSRIRGNCRLNLDLLKYIKTKNCMHYYRHIIPYGMICTVITLQEILCGMVLHLVPIPYYPDNTRSIISILLIEDRIMSMCIKK